MGPHITSHLHTVEWPLVLDVVPFLGQVEQVWHLPKLLTILSTYTVVFGKSRVSPREGKEITEMGGELGCKRSHP